MRIGVVFPQTEIGADPVAIRDYVQAAEDLGYSHLIAYDHVLGADTRFHQGWAGGYTLKDMFHEPFVAFGYMAAITRTLELVTAILILGQRQTALVAKQAAEVDVLSGGRLRLGVGIGWNHVEYEALGQDFHNRGRRSAEQISLLRALWTQEVVNFQGPLAPGNSRWYQSPTSAASHTNLDGGGRRLSPVPPERVLRRVARLADGWFPQFLPDDTGRETVVRVREYALEEGRDPSVIGMEARINIADGDPEF
jgi:probable F420-dependent oxidoreductase